MSQKLNRIALLIGAAILVGLYIFVAFYQKPARLGSGGPLESENYTLFTTSTLNTAYTGAGAVSSSVILVTGLPNIVIGGQYTPKSYGSKAYILIERSLDHGTTYVPYETITPGSSEIDINTSGSSTTPGTPFIVPGNATAASGTSIGFSFDMTLAADYIHVSVKESTTSTAGVINAKIIATSN